MPEPAPTVTLQIRRYDPDSGELPSWSTYQVPLLKRLTVLDALFYVVQHADGDVSFRCACRAAMCETCGMLMNGQSGLACRVQLADLGPVVRIEPLPDRPILKDLVV